MRWCTFRRTTGMGKQHLSRDDRIFMRGKLQGTRENMDVGVIVPEDKAEMMRLKPENIADDGSAVCKETGAFIVPEGWKEGSIELD